MSNNLLPILRVLTYYIYERGGVYLRRLYICNRSSDCISKINIDNFTEDKRINLHKDNMKIRGPQRICTYKHKLLVANKYSNSLSIIDINDEKNIEEFFIGMSCNDLGVYNNSVYIICGDSNNIFEFDLKIKRVVEEIPCGNLPKSIAIDKKRKIMVTSNFQEDSVTLIDCEDKSNIKKIKVGSFPVKALFSVDGQNLLVCESNLDSCRGGGISLISLKSFNSIYRVEVGSYPIDMYFNGCLAFTSNFGDGTISIVDMDKHKEIKRVIVGGMPSGIMKFNEELYVGDSYNNSLIRVNIFNENKKVIPLSGEPSGMTLL